MTYGDYSSFPYFEKAPYLFDAVFNKEEYCKQKEKASLFISSYRTSSNSLVKYLVPTYRAGVCVCVKLNLYIL